MAAEDYFSTGTYNGVNEVWKPVVGFEGLYEISNCGRVKSIGSYNTCKRGIMNPMVNTDGYLHVRLYNNGTSKDIGVHRLVAIAFIPNPMGYKCVNHKDENVRNNHVSNLEWCTNKYNIRYSRAKAIDVYSKDGKFIETLEAISDIVNKYGGSSSNISRCCKAQYGTYLGYQFRYHGEPFSKKPFVFTEYQRRKSRKGHSCSEGRYIPINVYATDGTFIKTYDSITKAAHAYGTTTGNICKCYKGKILTNKGLIFLIDDNIEARIQQLNNRKK